MKCMCGAQVDVLPAVTRGAKPLPARVVWAGGIDPHECPPSPRKVPNERDFCVCGTLTWGGLCDDCKPQPVKQAPERVSLIRLSDDELAQRIERGGEGTSAAKAEAKRRIQDHERDERERKRRAL